MANKRAIFERSKAIANWTLLSNVRSFRAFIKCILCVLHLTIKKDTVRNLLNLLAVPGQMLNMERESG